MLDDADLADLARTCARRFPRADDQRLIAAEAGITADHTDIGDAEVAWSQLLNIARRDGKLGKLAGVLSRSAPGDASLVAVAKALGDVVRPPRPKIPIAALFGLGVVLIFGVAGAAAMWWGSGQSPRPPPVASTTPANEVATTPAPLDPSAEPTPATVGVSGSVPASAEETNSVTTKPGSGETEPIKTNTIDTPPVKQAAIAPKVVPAENVVPRIGTCNGKPGEVLGYWYAGTTSPGTLGQTITLGRDARVRAEYPRAENGHNAAAREVCVLTRGTKMTLSAAPIDASRGHWWVPVVGG